MSNQRNANENKEMSFTPSTLAKCRKLVVGTWELRNPMHCEWKSAWNSHSDCPVQPSKVVDYPCSEKHRGVFKHSAYIINC